MGNFLSTAVNSWTNYGGAIETCRRFLNALLWVLISGAHAFEAGAGGTTEAETLECSKSIHVIVTGLSIESVISFDQVIL